MLQRRHSCSSQELSSLRSREVQTVVQWNLAMAAKEEEVEALTEQVASLTRDLALDQQELDLLAESEGGLMELSRSISDTTEQAKVNLLEYILQKYPKIYPAHYFCLPLFLCHPSLFEKPCHNLQIFTRFYTVLHNGKKSSEDNNCGVTRPFLGVLIRGV